MNSNAVTTPTCSLGERLEDKCCIGCTGPYVERCTTTYVADQAVEQVLSCVEGYYLLNGLCVNNCGLGYFGDDITRW